MINDTERRALLRSLTGARAPRHYTADQVEELMTTGEHPDTASLYKRRRVHQYIEQNWEFVKTTLTCSADCSSASNTCSDVQAAHCYEVNKRKVEP